MVPKFVSDPELAKCPLIVVAKWNDASWKNNSRVEDNIVKEYEVATEIEVIRVVQGDVAPGKLTILVGFAIGWSTERPFVSSYMSTEVAGEAAATEDNLWFLSKSRSRIDSKEYFYLSTHRGVQPLALEPYFKALQGQRIADHVPQLLRSDKEIVQLRTLELIAGGNFPWPYEPWSFLGRPKNSRPLKGHAVLVRSLIENANNKQVRRHAVAVYAHASGKASVPFMRTQLENEDPVVRGIAVGILAKHQDRKIADSMAKAVRGLNDPKVACAVIKRLDAWHDPAAAAALIEFLQDDGFAGRSGNDWDVPAIQSRESLFRITGHFFPFDVVKSREAWATAREIQDSDQRTEYLTSAAPCEPKPWHAKFLMEKDRSFIVLTNHSKKTITLATQPTDITVNFLRGCFGCGVDTDAALDKSDYVSVDAGRSYRFKLDTQHLEWLKEGLEKSSLSIDLAYMSNGNKVGVNAWLGVISVEIPGP